MGERCGNAQLRGSAPGPCGETGYRQSTNCGVGLACDAGSRQSRAGSLLEATTHVAVGFGLALTGQQFVLPLFGIEVGLATHSGIAALFTTPSLIRFCLLRRLFEHLHWMRLEDLRFKRERLRRRLAGGPY